METDSHSTQLNSTQPKCLLCAMLFLFIRLELGAEGLHHVFISKERRFERRFENRVREASAADAMSKASKSGSLRFAK